MEKEEWEKLMYEQDHRLLEKNQLPEHEELLSTLQALIPITGNVDELLHCRLQVLFFLQILLKLTVAYSGKICDNHTR